MKKGLILSLISLIFLSACEVTTEEACTIKWWKIRIYTLLKDNPDYKDGCLVESETKIWDINGTDRVCCLDK